MITPGQFFRVLAIQRILIRHGLDELLFTTPLFKSLRFVLYLLPWNWFRSDHGPRALRLRLLPGRRPRACPRGSAARQMAGWSLCLCSQRGWALEPLDAKGK